MWGFQSRIQANKDERKISYAWVGWLKGPCVITVFSQTETKFISVKNLISKLSITLLSENEVGTSICSPDVKQRFLASNSQGLHLEIKVTPWKGENSFIHSLNQYEGLLPNFLKTLLLNNEIWFVNHSKLSFHSHT